MSEPTPAELQLMLEATKEPIELTLSYREATQQRQRLYRIRKHLAQREHWAANQLAPLTITFVPASVPNGDMEVKMILAAGRVDFEEQIKRVLNKRGVSIDDEVTSEESIDAQFAALQEVSQSGVLDQEEPFSLEDLDAEVEKVMKGKKANAETASKKKEKSK